MERTCASCDRQAQKGKRYCMKCGQDPIPGCDSHPLQIAEGCDSCLAKFASSSERELDNGLDIIGEVDPRAFMDLRLSIGKQINPGPYAPRSLLRRWFAQKVLESGGNIDSLVDDIKQRSSFAHLVKKEA